MSVDPWNAAPYVLLGNTYAQLGRHEDAIRVRTQMRYNRVKKMPGTSCIEVNFQRHCFTVHDKSHPQIKEIYAKLDELNEKLKNAGFKPDTSWVLQDMPEHKKERVLCYHR